MNRGGEPAKIALGLLKLTVPGWRPLCWPRSALITTVGAAIALGVFAESVSRWRRVRRARRCVGCVANAYERLGDIEEAEASLLAAESLDPSWPLTLMSLARYASDRGDVERGLPLLRRAGVSADHNLVVLLEHFRPAPRRDIGRNDPCWCGSGRKYKVCHLNREQLPLGRARRVAVSET